MGSRKGGELLDQRLAFLGGNEPGGLDRVDQQLQLWAVKVTGCYVVLVLNAPVMYNVDAKLNKLCDVFPQSPGIWLRKPTVLQMLG